MTRRIVTRFSALVTQHSALLLLITFMFLLLFLPVVSWAADGVIDLPRTGQTKCYDTSGAEISCAGTGQDGEIQAGVAWPSPRFVDHGDGTVTDKLNGLMWTKGVNVVVRVMHWQEALDYVKTLNTGGHTDWRLPNVEELRSLIDYSQYNPSLPQGHPFTNAKASWYWSSTTNALNTDFAWFVDFLYGGVGNYYKTDGINVRAVRGGQCGSLGDSVICLPKTGQTKCYDEVGVEIACAGTGQDGDIQAGVAWPSPRFVDNGDGTVTDKLTGLMLIKDETEKILWQAALDYVKTLNTGGHTDWQLPNVEELRSLIDYSQYNPSLPQGHPFTNAGVSSYIYWSSTTHERNTTDYAWWVCFSDGSDGSSHKYSSNSYEDVRAVRGGQSDPSTTTTTVSGTDTTTTTSASSVSTTTTTAPSGTPCPAKTALGEQARELQPLRAFRDGVMKRSDQGSAYAELYYRNAPEISSLLEAHPELKEETHRLIMQLLPMMQALLAQKDGRIDAGTVTQATALLENLSALGSPALKADLVQLKKEMQSGRLFEELNISVAGR